jgi:hypothetical protein
MNTRPIMSLFVHEFVVCGQRLKMPVHRSCVTSLLFAKGFRGFPLVISYSFARDLPSLVSISLLM